MRCVRGELPLRAKLVVEAIKQAVERDAQALQLLEPAGAPEALRAVIQGDSACAFGHLLERLQGASDRPAAESKGDQEQGQRGDQ